jgi:hypothetical protein
MQIIHFFFSNSHSLKTTARTFNLPIYKVGIIIHKYKKCFGIQ